MKSFYISARSKYCLPLAVMGSSLLILVVLNYKYLSTYAVKSDDFSLLLYSASFFDISFIEWVTLGFKYYFANYPEAFIEFTNFVRPVVNATIYIESMFVKEPNSFLFLSTNYIGHSIGCALVYLYSRYLIKLNTILSLLAALLFFGSMSTQEGLFYYSAFRGDMLGAIFGMTALLLLHYHSRISGKELTTINTIAISLLLLLAVYSKETAIFSPLIVVVYYLGKCMESYSLCNLKKTVLTKYKMLILLLLPLVLYPVTLFMFYFSVDGPGAYPLMSTRLYLSPLLVSMQLFFPYREGFTLFKQLLLMILPAAVNTPSQGLDVLLVIRNAFALILNSISLLMLFYIVVIKRVKEIYIPATLMLLALVIPLTISPSHRFMYFGQMFAIPLFVYIIKHYYDIYCQQVIRKKYLISILIALVLMAILTNPTYFIYNTARSQNVEMNYRSIAFQEILAEEIQDPVIKRVYYINDTVGYYGSLSLLKFVAGLNERDDIYLRVVNSIRGQKNNGNLGCVEFYLSPESDEIIIKVEVKGGTELFFPGADNSKDNLGLPQFIEYSFDHGLNEVMYITIPDYSKKDFLIIGFDPCSKGIYKYDLDNEKWLKHKEISPDNSFN